MSIEMEGDVKASVELGRGYVRMMSMGISVCMKMRSEKMGMEMEIEVKNFDGKSSITYTFEHQSFPMWM